MTDKYNPFLPLTFYYDGCTGSFTSKEKECTSDKSSTSLENYGANKPENKDIDINTRMEKKECREMNEEIKESSSKRKKESNDLKPEVSRL